MTMAQVLVFGLAAVVTYLLSSTLYLSAALAYGIGLRPLIYGWILEVLTGILTVSLIRRERQDARWLVLLMGIVVGRSLRGISEVPVLKTLGGLSPANAARVVLVRIVLVGIGATVPMLYTSWRSRRRVA